MIYTESEIARISGSKLAVKGRIYIDNKGNRYRGTIDNRLEQLFTADKTIGVKLEVDDDTVRLDEHLRGIKSNITSIETNIDEIETNIDTIETNIDSIESDITDLQTEVDNIKVDFTRTFLLMGS